MRDREKPPSEGATGNEGDALRFKCAVCHKWHDGKHAKDVTDTIVSAHFCAECFWDPRNPKCSLMKRALEEIRSERGQAPSTK